MIKLPPDVKEKWLHDLRSGEYNQRRCFLESYDPDDKILGHCCMGVLVRGCGYSNNLGSSGYPAPGMLPWEVDMVINQIIPDDIKHKLSLNDYLIGQFLYRVNDYERWTFTRIADWIEENL